MDITIDLNEKMDVAEAGRLMNLLQNVARHSEWREYIDNFELNYGAEKLEKP